MPLTIQTDPHKYQVLTSVTSFTNTKRPNHGNTFKAGHFTPVSPTVTHKIDIRKCRTIGQFQSDVARSKNRHSRVCGLWP